MKKLSLLDLGFFVAESQASPKHVGGLLMFKRPPKAPVSFAKSLYREYLGFTEVAPPRTLFNWLAFRRMLVRRRTRAGPVPGGSNGMPFHTIEFSPTRRPTNAFGRPQLVTLFGAATVPMFTVVVVRPL